MNCSGDARKLKETFGRFYVKVRYLQFSVIVLAYLITFLLVSLIDQYLANKEKLVKAKLYWHSLDIVIYL